MKINGKRKKMNGYLILKMMCYQLLSVMLDIQGNGRINKTWDEK